MAQVTGLRHGSQAVNRQMVTKIKHYNPSASDLEADWHVLDARGKVLGRLASEAATLLMGKHRPAYVPHMLSGDFVVVVNAADVTVTGRKAEQIVYKRHSQKPGNLKQISYQQVQSKFPERIIEHAVRGMLPKNKLGAAMLKKLDLDSVLIVNEAFDEKVFLSARNLPNVGICDAASIDPVALMRFEKVLMTVPALKMIEERLS